MANRVIWSDEAVGDLERISQFIGRDSGAYARVVVRRALESTRRLTTFPRWDPAKALKLRWSCEAVNFASTIFPSGIKYGLTYEHTSS
jgi:hypothetical protein